jgi:hypothetical protein
MNPIDLALLDPGTYRVLGMRIRIQEQGNAPKHTNMSRYDLWSVTYIKVYFTCKNKTFSAAN